MTEATPLDAPENDAENGEEPTPLKVALAFFIVPLLLVIGGVGVFLLFGVLAHETAHPADYLPEINGRGINEPWQAAFHLSQQLQFNEELKGDAEFAAEVIRAMENASDGDPRVRRFLAIALGRIEHVSAVPVLTAHLQDVDPEVRVNSLWGLGALGDPDAAPAAALLLQDEIADVRTMASYVLGALANPATSTALQIALNDPVAAVRFNSAVALGMMGDAAGLDLLTLMIDREYLASVPGMVDTDQSATLLAALAAIRHLGSPNLASQLARVRDTDPDTRVREAAREALMAVRSADAGPFVVDER